MDINELDLNKRIVTKEEMSHEYSIVGEYWKELRHRKKGKYSYKEYEDSSWKRESVGQPCLFVLIFFLVFLVLQMLTWAFYVTSGHSKELIFGLVIFEFWQVIVYGAGRNIRNKGNMLFELKLCCMLSKLKFLIDVIAVITAVALKLSGLT